MCRGRVVVASGGRFRGGSGGNRFNGTSCCGGGSLMKQVMEVLMVVVHGWEVVKYNGGNVV